MPHLLGRHSEHVAHITCLYKHLKRALVLVYLHMRSVTSYYIFLKLCICSLLCYGTHRVKCRGAASQEKHYQTNQYNGIKPPHIKTWHIRLVLIIIASLLTHFLR